MFLVKQPDVPRETSDWDGTGAGSPGPGASKANFILVNFMAKKILKK